MSNHTLVKTYTATGAISAYRAVKFGSNDNEVVAGAAATDSLIGLSTDTDIASGERCDVVMEGTGFIKLGGTVTRGAFVTSDATGQGVAAAPGAGVNNRTIGIALQSGVSGDIITIKIDLNSIQG